MNSFSSILHSILILNPLDNFLYTAKCHLSNNAVILGWFWTCWTIKNPLIFRDLSRQLQKAFLLVLSLKPDFSSWPLRTYYVKKSIKTNIIKIFWKLRISSSLMTNVFKISKVLFLNVGEQKNRMGARGKEEKHFSGLYLCLPLVFLVRSTLSHSDLLKPFILAPSTTVLETSNFMPNPKLLSPTTLNSWIPSNHGSFPGLCLPPALDILPGKVSPLFAPQRLSHCRTFSSHLKWDR